MADIEGEPEEISDDWLNMFEREAVDTSTEHMQKLFGKILAGEIKRPKSYSIRTIKLIAQLDNAAADIFRRLCSLSCSLRAGPIIVDRRVLTLGEPAATNGLRNFGITFSDLNILLEYGLVISDFASSIIYSESIVNSNEIGLPIYYVGGIFGLVQKQPESFPGKVHEFRLQGVALSQAGKEISGIVDLIKNTEYTKNLYDYLDSIGYIMSFNES